MKLSTLFVAAALACGSAAVAAGTHDHGSAADSARGSAHQLAAGFTHALHKLGTATRHALHKADTALHHEHSS